MTFFLTSSFAPEIKKAKKERTDEMNEYKKGRA